MKNIEIIFVINLNHLETTLAKKYLFLTKIIRQLNSRKNLASLSFFYMYLLYSGPPLTYAHRCVHYSSSISLATSGT